MKKKESVPTIQSRKRASYHHGNLKQEAIKTALKLISEKGIRELSLREVAKTLGVSHVSIYHHFSTKDELLNELAANGFKLFNQIYEPVTNQHITGWKEALIRMSIRYVQFATENPAYYRAMYSADRKTNTANSKVQSQGDRAFNQLVAIIEHGIKIKAVEGKLDWIAAQVWTTLHGTSELVLADRLKFIVDFTNLNEFIVTQIRTLLNGLTPKCPLGVQSTKTDCS